MQRILKLKYQNAVSQVNLSEVDSPVIFVGGRRRNRKKRRSRNAGLLRQKLRHPVEKPAYTVVTKPAPHKNDNHGLGVYPVSTPVVSCLDIEDPVFISTDTAPADRHDDADDVAPQLTQLTDDTVVTHQPRRLARTTSDDSGIYDDETESQEATEHREHEEEEEDSDGADSDMGIDSEPEFEDVDLDVDLDGDSPPSVTNVPLPCDTTVVNTQPSPSAALIPPFIFGDFSETEEDEVETAISDNNKDPCITTELPTVLGDTAALDIVDSVDDSPARLTLDAIDADDDVVLFDAKVRKKLSVTSNPLYEYSLLEETRRYQGGYTTPFDNVNVIQMQPSNSNRIPSTGGTNVNSPENEKACCTIL